MADTIDISQEKVIQFAQDIIRFESITGNEGKLGLYLADFLEKSGLHVETHEVAPQRFNVYATLPGEDPESYLMFHSHMDTVPFGAMANPLSAEISDGHIWGRGSVDQKGGLAASVIALATIAQADVRLKGSLSLALVVDEESEHRGSMGLVDRGLNARQAIVTEPSGLRVVIGCKGTLPFRILVRGKASHGARPWLGVNAVHQAMKVLQALEKMEFLESTVPGYGVVKGSLNLGVIEGGRAYNIVPDQCQLWFDRRTVPGEDPRRVIDQIKSVLNDLASSEREDDIPVESELLIDRPDWDWEPIRTRGLKPTVSQADARIKDLVIKSHQDQMGNPPEIYFTDGYNEMDFLINDLNIPTVQYGPGDSTLCHTDGERLSIMQLVDATNVYSQVALRAAG